MTVDVFVSIEPDRIGAGDKRYHYELRAPKGTAAGNGAVYGTLHKATLEAVLKALSRFTQPAHIRIHVKDRYVAGVIGQLPEIAENRYRKKNGEEMALRNELERLYRFAVYHRLEGVAWRN